MKTNKLLVTKVTKSKIPVITFYIILSKIPMNILKGYVKDGTIDLSDKKKIPEWVVNFKKSLKRSLENIIGKL